MLANQNIAVRQSFPFLLRAQRVDEALQMSDRRVRLYQRLVVGSDDARITERGDLVAQALRPLFRFLHELGHQLKLASTLVQADAPDSCRHEGTTLIRETRAFCQFSTGEKENPPFSANLPRRVASSYPAGRINRVGVQLPEMTVTLEGPGTAEHRKFLVA